MAEFEVNEKPLKADVPKPAKKDKLSKEGIETESKNKPRISEF